MAALKLKILGRFEAGFKGGPAIDLPTKKTQLLLAYLALKAGEAQPRDKLASLLWSDRGDEQAATACATLSRAFATRWETRSLRRWLPTGKR